MTVREAVWLHKLLAYLFGHEMDSTIIQCNNRRCVNLSENLVFHDKSKHIEIKYHYIRDMVQRKVVLVQYIPTDEHFVDVLTKPLTRTKFKYFRERPGVRPCFPQFVNITILVEELWKTQRCECLF